MTPTPPGAAPGGVALEVRLAGQRVAVVGAGPVAARKLAPLRAAGARAVVVAPQAVEEIRAAAAAGGLTWHARAYAPGDLEGAVLAVAATGDADVDEAVAAEAAARATLCVRTGGGGSAAFAATARRGPLLLAVSTGGAAPALARALRHELEERYGPEYGALAALLGELRADPEVRGRLAALTPGERRARWRAALDPDILGLIRSGRADRAREVAIACLFSPSD